jgi:hypothetical protein
MKNTVIILMAALLVGCTKEKQNKVGNVYAGTKWERISDPKMKLGFTNSEITFSSEKNSYTYPYEILRNDTLKYNKGYHVVKILNDSLVLTVLYVPPVVYYYKRAN